MASLIRFSLIVAAGIGSASLGAAAAQTTSCGWVLGRWTCETQQAGGVFGGLQSPTAVGQSVMDSYYRGVQMRQERERAEAERHRLIAERQAYEATTRAAERQAPPVQNIQPQTDFVAPLEQRQQIGEMLKAGHCKPAVDRALELGDIQLATNIKAFCAGGEVNIAP